jgi:hypothetical protein
VLLSCGHSRYFSYVGLAVLVVEASRIMAFGTVAHLEDTHFALERDIHKTKIYTNIYKHC